MLQLAEQPLHKISLEQLNSIGYDIDLGELEADNLGLSNLDDWASEWQSSLGTYNADIDEFYGPQSRDQMGRSADLKRVLDHLVSDHDQRDHIISWAPDQTALLEDDFLGDVKSGFNQFGKKLDQAVDKTIDGTKQFAKKVDHGFDKAIDATKDGLKAAKPYAKKGLHYAAKGATVAAPIVSVAYPPGAPVAIGVAAGLNVADRLVNPEMQKKLALLQQLGQHH